MCEILCNFGCLFLPQSQFFLALILIRLTEFTGSSLHQAWLKNWKVLVVYLQDEALTSAGLKFTTSTPGTEFLGKQVSFEFERSNGRGGMQLHTGLAGALARLKWLPVLR